MRVDAAAVEAELSRLQRELTNSEVRTSLFNLVVMSPDAERAMVDEALTYILGKRAARVIHIVNRDVAESSLEVSARCYIDHERKGVCFEEVIITNGNDAAGGAPGSWTPLLIRDIPTYVLWLDRLTGHQELFRHARNQADKVIVDSDLSVELGDDTDSLLADLARAARDPGAPLSDFSWKRLLPIRKLLADAFSGDRTSLLPEIATVTVRGLAPVAAQLFGLWLGERLGWKCADGGLPRFTDVQGRAIEFSVDEGEPGCALELQVALRDGSEIQVAAGVDGCAEVEYPGGSGQPSVDVPDSGEILLEEVDAVSADSYYRRALLTLPAHILD